MAPGDAAYSVALDREGLTAFPALEDVERDGWFFRASGGLNRRVDSATVHNPDIGSLGDRLRQVSAFYGERSQDILVRVPALWPDFEFALAAQGWRRFRPCLVLERPLGDHAGPPAPGALKEVPLERWVSVLIAAGGVKPGNEAAFRAIQDRLSAPAHRFVWAGDDGEPRGAAMLVRTGQRAGLLNMIVHPHARGQGISRRIMEGLHGWARAQGLSGLWLQVFEENTPAIRLYRSEGWLFRYRYWYWEPII